MNVGTVALDLQPVLHGSLLKLRPLQADDFDALHRIASDARLWEQHPSKDRTDETVFRRWFHEALSSRGALVAQDAASGEVIGTSRYVVRPDGAIEIGWTFLAYSHWGGRWNAEMKRLMLGHAFEVVAEVIFVVHSDNVRSRRAVERLGAVWIGTEPDSHGRGENHVFRLYRPSEDRSSRSADLRPTDPYVG